MEHKDRETIIQKMIDKQKQVIQSLSEDRRNLKIKLKELHRDFFIVNEKRKQYEEQLKKKNFGYPIDSVKSLTRYNSFPDFLSEVRI